MDKATYLVYLPFVVGITFCASLLSAGVIVDNPLDDSDMNGINASVWQDLPLEMDDKSPIVLIAKPFTQLNLDSSGKTPNVSDVRMNQTEDFFASITVTATPPLAFNQFRKSASDDSNADDTNHDSSPSGSGFVNFANFRKKFSRLIPL